MTLSELLEELEKRDPNKEVINGFGEGMSWRGSYSEASFEPLQSTTYGDMLNSATELLGTYQEGYKGGEYLMHGDVDVHIAHYGDTGEPITSFHFRFWDGC